MLRRAAGSMIASLLLWLGAVAGVTSSAPRVRSSFEVDAAAGSTALVTRTLCVERGTITIGALSLDRRAHARWSPGALTNADCATVSRARVRGVLFARPRAHLPHALRRTYDAHAPPRAIDFV